MWTTETERIHECINPVIGVIKLICPDTTKYPKEHNNWHLCWAGSTVIVGTFGEDVRLLIHRANKHIVAELERAIEAQADAE